MALAKIDRKTIPIELYIYTALIAQRMAPSDVRGCFIYLFQKGVIHNSGNRMSFIKGSLKRYWIDEQLDAREWDHKRTEHFDAHSCLSVRHCDVKFLAQIYHAVQLYYITEVV